MSVRVCHRSTDMQSMVLKFTDHESNSWTVDSGGHLIVGDFHGSPEATHAPGNWQNIVKNDEVDSDDPGDVD